MSDHQEKADAVEAEIDGLQRESDQLDAQISETRDDWERKKVDDKVPGATETPEEADPDPPQPEE